MKAISILILLVVFAISGCKKDYTCTCTETIVDTFGTDTRTTTTTINKAKKSDANLACGNYQSTYNSSTYNSTSTSNCTLK